jgi:hypothetical protein
MGTHSIILSLILLGHLSIFEFLHLASDYHRRFPHTPFDIIHLNFGPHFIELVTALINSTIKLSLGNALFDFSLGEFIKHIVCVSSG